MTKSNFMLRNALTRYTSIRSSSASGTTHHLPLEGKAYCRISLFRQRISNCVEAYPFFFLRRKKNSEKERPLRGLRREVSPDLLRRTEMKSKAGAQCGSAPRDPPENGQGGRDKQQRCCAQRRKFPCSGQKPVCSASRAARFLFGFPLRGSCQRQLTDEV